ncbi:MAG: hypothetical protein M0Z76_05575 [Gammaproteobacteria bacterium]|nr:hypothetical protein [Gammaproteobacteria bacterium]
MKTEPGRQDVWVHGPSMRFIEDVVRADDRSLVARVHRLDADHPLAQQGRVGAAILIEYAAQAAAAHAPYCGETPRKAYVAAVHAVKWRCEALDGALLPFDIEVTLESRTDAAVRYAFTARHAGQMLGQGQLTLAYAGRDS